MSEFLSLRGVKRRSNPGQLTTGIAALRYRFARNDMFCEGRMEKRRMPLGQGLLETTIAIGVITTGLFAVITLVFSNSRSSDEAELRFSAVQLAREGVEVVRAKRDSNWLAIDLPGLTGDLPVEWSSGIIDGGIKRIVLVNPLGGDQKIVDANGITIDDALVRRDRDKGFLVQGPDGDATPFRRLVTLTPICVDGSPSCSINTNPMIGVLVQSKVQWTVRGQTKDVTIEERLYDWR